MDYTSQIDYSSLSTYLTCPRKFFFQYVLHLRPAGPPSLDLIFGSCWHFGLETAYKKLKDNPKESPLSLTKIASEAFNRLWELEAAEWYHPDTAFPKSPTRAADMYYKYFQDYTHVDSQAEIIGVEEPFTIALGNGLPSYIGRIDLAVLRDGDLEIIEHKTSKYANQVTYAGYKNSLQCEGYLAAGHLYFSKLPRIVYNLALCQKSKIEHFRYPITKSASKIDRFLLDLCKHCKDILTDLEGYQSWSSTKKEDVFPWFDRRPGMACTQFFRTCDYYDLCLARNNPTLWKDNPPSGFQIQEWDPSTHEAQIKEKVGDLS